MSSELMIKSEFEWILKRISHHQNRQMVHMNDKVDWELCWWWCLNVLRTNRVKHVLSEMNIKKWEKRKRERVQCCVVHLLHNDHFNDDDDDENDGDEGYDNVYWWSPFYSMNDSCLNDRQLQHNNRTIVSNMREGEKEREITK